MGGVCFGGVWGSREGVPSRVGGGRGGGSIYWVRGGHFGPFRGQIWPNLDDFGPFPGFWPNFPVFGPPGGSNLGVFRGFRGGRGGSGNGQKLEIPGHPRPVIRCFSIPPIRPNALIISTPGNVRFSGSPGHHPHLGGRKVRAWGAYANRRSWPFLIRTRGVSRRGVFDQTTRKLAEIDKSTLLG